MPVALLDMSLDAIVSLKQTVVLAYNDIAAAGR